MALDWSTLREPAPGKLAAARETAHYALQWVARAARANLPAAPDDSHSALLWDAELQGLVTQPLQPGAKLGLRIATLEMVFTKDGKPATLAMPGRTQAAANDWLDRELAARKLKPASATKLPYEVPVRPFSKERGLDALARWFAAAAEALGEARARHQDLAPGPVYLWPHHFDLATLLTVAPEKTIGVGVSPGDHYYAQPYAYISVYPAPKGAKPPALPPGGHWHEKDFFGAVATADELLAQPDPRAALLAVIDAAVAAGRGWLHG